MKIFLIRLFFFCLPPFVLAQTFYPADPFYLLQYERAQFQNKLPIQSNIFRPLFFSTDSLEFSLTLRSEGYFNNNAPNQENMDVRYFSKGFANFNSVQLAFNSPYLLFLAEPYIINSKFSEVTGIDRYSSFSVLNDRPLIGDLDPDKSGFRNFLIFAHYKGFGIGWQKGNRWWGPGIHTSLQMTNNTIPMPSQIIGTLNELRFGSLGIYALYSFSRINEERGAKAKYFTSLNGQISWYSSIIINLGFSRNYLTGGPNISNYVWTEKDAKKIVFEDLLTIDLLDNEYTLGGQDLWDQTLSTYINIILPKRGLKIYGEVGFNDNRMYFADFLSQPDHSMATIIGIRDIGLKFTNNFIWGFEWANLMITYTSRHRPTGSGAWYTKDQFDYSSYKGRRWGSHSGSDSDDWYLYFGYLSDYLMIIPALNYERHGIVSNRPAEVKMEFRLDTRYKYKETWFGIYFEKQFEAFLGFPKYFYIDDQGNPTGYFNQDGLANSRKTNTLIFSISKTINY